jgi:hypothetical protein
VVSSLSAERLIGTEQKDVPVSTPEVATSGRAADEEISPELALVDPETAQRARRALPETVLTEDLIGLGRREASTAPPLAALASELAHDVDAREVERPPELAYDELRRASEAAEIEEPPRPRRRRAVVLAGLVVGAAAALLITPRALDDRNSSARTATPLGSVEHISTLPTVRRSEGATTRSGVLGVRTTAPTERTTSAAPTTDRRTVATVSPRRAPLPARTIRNFGWVPVKHAVGYRVEFRNGPKLVLRVRTRAARLRLSLAQLRPGRYHWFVWRLNQRGTPIGAALVDATLKVR